MKEIATIYPQIYLAVENIAGTETVFFRFEEDFVQDNVRCIPMIVRFKLDACGIKLKLTEWSKISIEERKTLMKMLCSSNKDILYYRNYLRQLVVKRSGVEATDLPVEFNPAWANINELPVILIERMKEFKGDISLQQWQDLNNLQRFVLLKLCKPGHEHKNFPKAIKEFGLV